ncbi:MAG: prenyltransferase/squalene oxidase repeat-containing protein [Planctomycetota bacterium]
MKCQKDYDLVGYFNGEMNDAEKSEIKQHLVSCFACRRGLEDIKESILSLRNLPEIEPSPDFTKNVIDCVKKEYARPTLVVPEQEFISLWNIIKYYLRRSPPWAVSAALHIIIFAAFTFIFVNQIPKSFNPYGNRWTNIYLPKESNLPDGQAGIEEHKTVVDSVASSHIPEFMINQKELINKISQGDDKIIKHIVNRVDEENREELLAKYNGKETVQAVSRGTKWLAQSQEETGNWVPSKYGGRDEYTAALTGLAILCFTGQGNSHLKGDFSRTVNKSVKYLISVQQPNGLFSTSLPDLASGQAAMYNHGIATYALLEDYLIAHNYPESEYDELTKELGEVIIKAISFIIKAQSNNGGWGYIPKSSLPDTSVTVWQIQALRLASILDMPGVEYALYKSRQWLCDVTDDNGFVGYQSLLDYPNGPYALTAAGSIAYLWIDSLPIMKSDKQDDVIKKRLDGLHRKQIDLLTENLPRVGKISIENDFYYCYWGSMAMISPPPDGQVVGNSEWEKWNAQIKEILIKSQSETGNWQVNDKWGMFGGQLYATTIAVLTLQVYYRYPPMGVKSS